MAMRYPDSRNMRSIEDGSAFEDYVLARLARSDMPATPLPHKEDQIAIGDALFLNDEGLEIKLDARCFETSRLSIEIAEKTAIDRNWIASGIHAASSFVWYCQGNMLAFWLFRRGDLLDWQARHRPEEFETETVRKFYVPIRRLHAARPYWTLPHDLLGMHFTPIPEDWVTNHEADQALETLRTIARQKPRRS